MYRRYKDAAFIAAAALLFALLAQSPAVPGVLAILLGAIGPILVPIVLLYRERDRQRARSRAFIQRLIDGIPDSFFLKDAESRYVMINTAFARERGLVRDNIVGRTSAEIYSSKPEAEEAAVEDQAVIRGEAFHKEQLVEHPVSGERYYRVVTKHRVESEDGVPLVMGAYTNITPWKLAELDLQAALGREKDNSERVRQFAQRLLDVIPMPVYVKDAQSRYVIVNATQAREWERPAEELIGVTSMSLAPTREIARVMREEDVAVLAGHSVHKEEANHHPVTGKGRFRLVTKGACLDSDGAPVIVCTQFDITRWKVAERELERLALEDSLTGLANRRCFLAEAERIASLADRHKQALSLLIFDLDNFKRVNDEHGHQAGDDVLLEVAERTRKSLRTEDVPGRWGGEEFVVLLPLTGIQEAMVAAERLRAIIAKTQISTSVGPLAVTISCGVAEREPDESILALVGRADAALYRAKNSGRNACVAASPP